MRLSIKKLLVAVLVVIAVWPVSLAWATTHDVHEGEIQVELTEDSTKGSTKESSTQESSGTGNGSKNQSPSKPASSSGKSGSLLKANESASYMLSFVGTMLFIIGLSYFVKRHRRNRE